jgi:hypothetical protein
MPAKKVQELLYFQAVGVVRRGEVARTNGEGVKVARAGREIAFDRSSSARCRARVGAPMLRAKKRPIDHPKHAARFPPLNRERKGADLPAPRFVY